MGLYGKSERSFFKTLVMSAKLKTQTVLGRSAPLLVGKRFDERAQVFAGNRPLRPDSEQYRTLYETHPDLKFLDAERRKIGGPLGHPGIIDRPHHRPNVAATCFEYWGKVGTDCNMCMRVCPWTHAGTFPHKVIKEFVTRNKMSRHLFSVMDDTFYGKKPNANEPPEWVQFGK